MVLRHDEVVVSANYAETLCPNLSGEKVSRILGRSDFLDHIDHGAAAIAFYDRAIAVRPSRFQAHYAPIIVVSEGAAVLGAAAIRRRQHDGVGGREPVLDLPGQAELARHRGIGVADPVHPGRVTVQPGTGLVLSIQQKGSAAVMRRASREYRTSVTSRARDTGRRPRTNGEGPTRSALAPRHAMRPLPRVTSRG